MNDPTDHPPDFSDLRRQAETQLETEAIPPGELDPAEAALRESEERYRSLFQNSHAVMLLIDSGTGAIVDANPAASAYYGYSLADLRGRQISTINTLGPDLIKEEMQQAKDQERQHFEFKHRLASGEIRDVEVFSGPIRVGGRELLYSIVHDVTARREAEAAVRESEARFRSLFENMTEGVVINEIVYDDQGTAVDYRIVATNPAFVVHTGLTPEQSEGRLASEVYGSGEPPYLGIFARVTASGQPEVLETYFSPLKRHFAVSATSPKPGQFVTVFEDITQRKRMEEDLRRAHDELEQRVDERTADLRLANEQLLSEIEERQAIEHKLQESEARFMAFMEHLPGLAVMRDVEGRYLFANRTWEEVMGLTPGAWQGKTLSELWPPEQAADLQKADFQIVSTGTPLERVETLELADGPHAFLNTRFSIKDAEGQPYMIGNIAMDITDRQRAEEQEAETGRLYRVLSRVNEAIIRVRDQESLFLQICRIAVEEGLFRLAWVGLTSPLDQKIRAVAKFGFDMGYLDNLEIPVADGPESRGPTGTAVREDRSDICNDFASDPHMAPWREKALERGFRSSGAFPLRIGARVVGALSLYAHRPGFFTGNEIALLTSLADNLSFALESLDREVRRRQAEEALADHARLVHDLYNHAPCGYHSLDQEGTFVQINDTELAMLGYSRQEVVGRLKFTDLITPESLPTFYATFPDLKARGWVKNLEYDIVRKDGTTFPVSLSGTAVTDRNGNFLMSRSTMVDITERRRAEAASVAERQRFLDLLENLPAFVYLQAPDYSLTFANREFRKRFGEPGDHACYRLIWGQDNPCTECPTFSVFHSGQPKEWEWGAPDGRTYHVYDYPFVDVDGSPLVLEMGIDITERKRSEEALRESQRKLHYLAEQLLVAQENERKRLAAELHDQLGHALLALKLHLSMIANKLPPDQHEIKGEIRTQLDYINGVIQDIRRLYHDLSPGKVEDLGLTKALRILVRDFADGMPQVAWEVKLADLDGVFALPVQTAIYRIFQEALTNIGKHAHPTAISIAVTREDRLVYFNIQDNGAGFDTARVLGVRRSGRGVGLAAMEERLNMLGGSFEIQSREQAGTRLSFTIPTLPEGEQS
jgi:PAS domain S-box-containing protein